MSLVVYYIDTWFIPTGVSTEISLMVMQNFFLLKTSFFQSQFVYSWPILKSKGMDAIFLKNKIFENIDKNVENLKIF